MRLSRATRGVMVAVVAMVSLVCEPLPGWGADAAKTDWLSQAHWGVMTHYLGAPPSSAGGAELTADMWNAQVDAFDVDALAEQLSSTGAQYLLFFEDEPNFASFAAVLKAGNPDALVAFNPGVLVPVMAHSKYEDYAAGEVDLSRLPDAVAQCHGRWLECEGSRVQFHILTFLGSSWCQGDRPQETDEKIIGYTRAVAAQGGAITFDVPIQPSGRIPQPFVDQLRAVGRALR